MTECRSSIESTSSHGERSSRLSRLVTPILLAVSAQLSGALTNPAHAQEARSIAAFADEKKDAPKDGKNDTDYPGSEGSTERGARTLTAMRTAAELQQTLQRLKAIKGPDTEFKLANIAVFNDALANVTPGTQKIFYRNDAASAMAKIIPLLQEKGVKTDAQKERWAQAHMRLGELRDQARIEATAIADDLEKQGQAARAKTYREFAEYRFCTAIAAYSEARHHPKFAKVAEAAIALVEKDMDATYAPKKEKR